MPLLPAIDTRWDVTPSQARAEQERLLPRIDLRPLPGPPHLILGADTSYNRGSNRVAGAVVLWDAVARCVVEQHTAVVETRFPYVPGRLAFREAPALMPALAALTRRPDVLVFNGHGIAHPLGIGLAAHLGVVFDLPAMGVAQKRLCGEHAPVGPRVGDRQPLILDGNTVGMVLRTRKGCNPVYISPGHRMTVEDALKVANLTNCGYKLSEVVRLAHELCNSARRADGAPKESAYTCF
ncbi:MAG: endonuclease V [Nitrospirota bacterium]|nr:endonuclease V [Nitrospirota bacterium]